jgi:Arc/MetJ-type ribon-helix-helix transcriptional regulator
MPRNPQTTAAFTVSLPLPLAREIERRRKAEHRSRSELAREAFRVYLKHQAALDELDQLITEGVNSGPPVPVTPGWWQERYATLERRRRERMKKQHRKRA